MSEKQGGVCLSIAVKNIKGELYINAKSLTNYVNWYAKKNGFNMHTMIHAVSRTCGIVKVQKRWYAPVSGIKAYIEKLDSCPMARSGYRYYKMRASAFRNALEHFLKSDINHTQKLKDTRLTPEQIRLFDGPVFPWAA